MQADFLIDEQTAWFEQNMLKIARGLRNRINTLLNQFDRKGGSILNTPKNITRLNQVYGSILQELQKSGYSDLVNQLNARENELLKSLKTARPTGAVPIAFTQTTQEALAAFNSLWNIQFGGLGTDIARQIAGVVGNTIFAGGTIDAAIRQVKSLLDDKFVRYAVTYVNTSRGKFLQLAEYNAASQEGDTYWEYQGPNDNVTRPVCQIGVGASPDASYPTAPYFTDAERQSFEAESASDREYNCRHIFIQITKEYYNEMTGGA